jgi:hypothetical protein
LSGEVLHEKAKRFVQNISQFFDNRFDFHVDETAYDGGVLAAALLIGTESVRFDIMMSRRSRQTAVHYCCECKWRNEPVSLRSELKEFIVKSRKVANHLHGRYRDGFGFIFFTNQPFGITNQNLGDLEYLRSLIDGEIPINELRMVSDKLRIVILDDWLLEATVGVTE